MKSNNKNKQLHFVSLRKQKKLHKINHTRKICSNWFSISAWIKCQGKNVILEETCKSQQSQWLLMTVPQFYSSNCKSLITSGFYFGSRDTEKKLVGIPVHWWAMYILMVLRLQNAFDQPNFSSKDYSTQSVVAVQLMSISRKFQNMSSGLLNIVLKDELD